MPSQYPYSRHISNSYLGKSKTVKGMSPSEVETKARVQIQKWDEEEERARDRAKRQAAIKSGKEKAAFLNKELQKEIRSINDTLPNAVQMNVSELWKSDIYRYDDFKPFSYHEPPTFNTAISCVGGIPDKSFIEHFSKKKRGLRESQEKAARTKFEQLQEEYEEAKRKAIEKYENDRESFYAERQEHNDRNYRIACATTDDPELFQAFMNMVLRLMSMRLYGKPEMEAILSPDKKMLQVNVSLLGPDGIPSIKEYKYVATRNEITKTTLRKTEAAALYDTYAFSIVASVFSCLHKTLSERNIDSMIVNAWVSGIDARTGNDFTSCILSVQAACDELSAIDFARVDPKECIRGLKGLYAGSSLTNLIPIAPVANLNREDSRFVESRDVLSGMDPSQNLAIMDWHDFEQLIRQLFGNIFETASGGEVRITQASRDAGVDAVAFDPDPIRGGKFVIQAKRYNNVVGVSAVRDLYGTMINEGAGKGLLVTTSYFGKDSHEFAKDKPIQLIDGSHLLGLLEQYGYGRFNITLGTGLTER